MLKLAQTDQQTDQQTGQKQYVPLYYSGGHKNNPASSLDRSLAHRQKSFFRLQNQRGSQGFTLRLDRMLTHIVMMMMNNVNDDDDSDEDKSIIYNQITSDLCTCINVCTLFYISIKF
ncbi:hypothetical protein DPMN_182866 [Dreissena polymorpha]|uniref:Uncharacterized protein n=1 Tax=Dreissena polymorpha TaxID=45954 RepID=A0A9D4I324_DREPO|nr:hypothetical protein DPMN_182866 [Dreissena polymorpha]